MIKFRRNAKRLGLCKSFSERWDNCRSKLQLYKLACDVNSLAYIAETVANGYGLSQDYIIKEFGQFINGKCISDADGYTSCIYCEPDELNLSINTTAALVIGYNGTIYIPKYRICEIYLCNSHVHILGDGKGVVYLYNSIIDKSDTSPIIIKENKKY